MMKTNFSVSVVIPLYNKEASIEQTIHTVLSQTLLPQEIIVVNDGSSDRSFEIVKSLNNPLIKLLDQANGGVSVARNAGVAFANTEWIAFLDADDLWEETFLSEIRKLNQTFPSANVLASAYNLIELNGLKHHAELHNIKFDGMSGRMENYFAVASSSSPPICASAVVIRKNAFNAIGGFPVGVKSGEDLVTWAKLAASNEIAYTRKALASFILAPSHSYFDRPNRIPETPDFVGRELLKMSELSAKSKDLLHYLSFWKKTRAQAFLRLGMRKNALKESLLTLSYNPKNKIVFLYLILLFFPNRFVNQVFRWYKKSKI